MDDAIRKAEALIEACQYLRTFRDRLIVIKLGGSAMEEPAALQTTLQDVVFLATVGVRPVLVHGGGKPIDRAMARAGLQPKKIQGRRYTDRATLDIVVQVLLQEINSDITAQIRQLGGRAVALHGGTSEALQALHGERLLLSGPENTPIDLGYVGQVTRVDRELIETFCAGGVIPVIPSVALQLSPETPDPTSPAFSAQPADTSVTKAWLNVNADTAAAAVAAELRAEKLVFLTDTPGILRDRNDSASLISHLNAAGCADLIGEGIIDSGMIPKVEACLDSLKAGVRKTHMIDGRTPHALLLEIYTDRGIGSEIVL